MSTLEVIRSNKGKHKIIHNGFMYTKHNAVGSNVRWRCVKRGNRCKGSIFTTVDFHNPRVTVGHNHEPDYNAIEFARCRTLLADRHSRLLDGRVVESDSMAADVAGPSGAAVSADSFLQSLNMFQEPPAHNFRQRQLSGEWTIPQQAPSAPPKPVVPPPPPMKKAPPPAPPAPPKARPVSPPAPPPEVCLRWNSYHSNMQATFPALLSNEQFVDVTLACEGRSIKCHKMILSACSAYLEELLSQNPCQHPIVLLKDLRFWEVQALVDFMYRGEVNVGQDRLPSLLAAAEALQIKGLAGPTSAASSHDEDSLPPSLPEYAEENAPSPSGGRRGRKRRSVPAPPPQPQPQVVARNPVGRPRIRASGPVPSTSGYQDSPPSEPPSQRPRRHEPPPTEHEIKIEPVDIDISNDSMDPIDGYDLNKAFEGAVADGESSNHADDSASDRNDSISGDTKPPVLLQGHGSDQMDYGNNNGTSPGNDFPFPQNRQPADTTSAFRDGVVNPGSSGGGGGGGGGAVGHM